MKEATATALPRRIGDRYVVQGVLGRGGMAIAYHVTDALTGKELALKQLVVEEGDNAIKETASLFEREFHTLAQLSHPRIIEVFDYGVDDESPYYTMELLDGGDLRQKTPLSWREACSLSYDVCSSLALIHSRRLVHRDVTPRNIRCTRDGQAKLIDFGAMVPMGPGAVPIGTPSFVAPEIVMGSTLDGRADLFSLGATLYYALTGRAAYPAREFVDLPEVWMNKPPPPSHFAEGVPSALDALVVALLDVDPSMRPHTAFEVMHRLSAIAGLERVEPPGVSRAYLTTPVMVGRDEAVRELHAQMDRAFGGRGRSILIVGAPGVGRSRMLDACAMMAKISGATVVRAGGKIGRADSFSVVRTLAEQLRRMLPGSAAPEHGFSSLERPEEREALISFVLRASQARPLLLAVDDAEHADEPSIALLASLASQANGHRLLVAAVAESDLRKDDALGLLARHSKSVTLTDLTAQQTEALLRSVFGDVPNVGLVGREIHAVSRGNPRACMDVAQHLVDRGRVLYEAGTWTLPSVLDSADLPASAEEAIRARIDALSPLSRRIAEAQALASRAVFRREDYALLCPGQGGDEVDRAILELLSHQLLVSNGRELTLSHAGWKSALTARLSDAQLRERHLSLVAVYETNPGLLVIHHLLESGDAARALDRLAEVLALAGDAVGAGKLSDLDTTQVAEILRKSIDHARELGRHPREVHDLRRWLASQSVASDQAFYWHVAPDWLAQLEHDSGLDQWNELTGVADEAERRSQALGLAYQRYGATAESERVYRPDEAIKRLVHYVVISIAIGSRTHDVPLLRSLPRLLEPFAPLSPVIDAMMHNAIATCEAVCDGQTEAYLARSLDVHRRLEQMTSEELPHVDVIRHAIEFGLGVASANIGLASATEWAERLEQDSLHQINALYLRKAIRLQAGDREGAEEFRKKAEILALQSRTRQMFDSTLVLELTVHAMARDLTGLKQLMDRIELRAARSPGWVPYSHIGEGHFQHICGNFELSRAAFERAIALSRPDSRDSSRLVAAFPAAVAGLIASLVDLGRVEDAKVEGERSVEACVAHGIQAQSHPVVRALALAEAKLGDFDTAARRLEDVIRAQKERGVTGLLLGATYEARARVAIWAGDTAAVQRFGLLTAQEYRHGHGSPLGARYERLMDEARRTTTLTLPKLWHFESTRMADSRESASAVVTRLLRGAESAKERGARALQAICASEGSHEGHLYLCGDEGPRLIASLGAAEPPSTLLEYVCAYLNRQIETDNFETAVLSEAMVLPDPKALSETRSEVFVDERGRSYRPILLTAIGNQSARHAAIAVVAEGAGVGRSAEFALTSELAGHLIAAGDTWGVAVEPGER